MGRQVPLYLGILVAAFSTKTWIQDWGIQHPEEERKQAPLAYTGWEERG